jgi:hypothetical protein
MLVWNTQVLLTALGYEPRNRRGLLSSASFVCYLSIQAGRPRGGALPGRVDQPSRSSAALLLSHSSLGLHQIQLI